ncbi:Unknown protein sequence [Pseudomonas amygdali pv. lachrymans]|uniref:Uncharacterized protein n=1 Tax=Pseudomonas amygdali pv. lachrymans TaxID=53707 RepID=A0ABR5KX00_PSEAV|nr:Unknown protein sequence [Pseudomonas amygdali pv. lachrymans]KPC19675.1 Unknown protein sequence [Pseudomonas amygdali pv. lachrymans]
MVSARAEIAIKQLQASSYQLQAKSDRGPASGSMARSLAA